MTLHLSLTAIRLSLAEMDGVTDVEELNRVLDSTVGLRAFLADNERIEKVAAFVAEHFRVSRRSATRCFWQRSTTKPAPSTSTP